ncbi:MAG TPA: DUF3052 domain-containing protein [Gemmatimonadales bacterium]|nr:DUF3052 domain-containing protein [Gemmatimonadales bacterium]
MPGAPGSGYSGTPLAGKLGIREASAVWAINPPGNYRRLLAPLPRGVRFITRAPDAGIIHLFTDQRAELDRILKRLRGRIRPDAAVWISWPKRASKVPTDITEDTIREVALPLGYVDIKVAAFDEVWSALKLVIRKELR